MTMVQIPAELFEEITGCDVDGMEPARHDKRLAVRVPLSARTNAFPLAAGRMGIAVAVQVREISINGVGLLHAPGTPLGDVFILCLKLRSGKAVSIYCTSVRTRIIGRTLAATGARFLRIGAEVPASEPVPASGRAETAMHATEAKRIRKALFE